MLLFIPLSPLTRGTFFFTLNYMESGGSSDNVGMGREFTRRLFSGEDVVVGQEIVDFLKSEGLGVEIVKSPNKNNLKTRVIVDRNPGEEDFTVRQQTENNRPTLGIVLPTGRKDNEFVYVSVLEEGFVFTTDDERAKKFDPSEQIDYSIGLTMTFSQCFNLVMRSVKDQKIVHEGKNPETYVAIVVEAVKKERERVLRNKASRSVARNNIFKNLFGGD